MSEVGDYKQEVKTMSYSALVKDADMWKKQQSGATGEYGYWGGVTGQEIVEAELERRTGKVYKVLRDFVDSDGILRKSGSPIMENQLTPLMLTPLNTYGFIAFIKEK